MDTGTASVIAAAVTGGFAVLVAVVHRFRKENHVDHQVVIGMLKLVHRSQQRVEDKVERVDGRLTNHIESHALGEMLDNGRTIEQNGTEGDSKISS